MKKFEFRLKGRGWFPTCSDLIIFNPALQSRVSLFFVCFLKFDMVEEGVVFDGETMKKGWFLIFGHPHIDMSQIRL